MPEARYTVTEFLLTHMSWISMIQRCKGSGRKDAPFYKDLGIQICDRWVSFENFIEDMGPRPGKTFTLDRFPNGAGNYEPGNCRWATAREQANNMRNVKLLTYKGVSRSIAEWARHTGLNRATLQLRIRQGMPVEQALILPPNAVNPSYVTFAEGRAHGKKLSREDVLRIVEMAKNGATSRSLGEDFGVSDSAISCILKQFGVPRKKGRPKR